MPDNEAVNGTPGTPAPATAGVPTTTEFRFKAGAGVPDWAVGLTVSEVNAVGKVFESVQRSPQAPDLGKPWEQVPAQKAPEAALPTQDDWLANPQEAFNRGIEAVTQQRLGPILASITGNMAQTVRSQAEVRFGEAFKRWGNEIEKEMSVVPPEQRSLPLYEKVVDIVKGRHVEELAEERLRDRLAGMPALERSGGTAGATGVPIQGLDFEKLPPRVKETWQKAGITEATVREDCARWGMTPEQLLAITARGDVVTETVDGTFQVTSDALKIPKGAYR